MFKHAVLWLPMINYESIKIFFLLRRSTMQMRNFLVETKEDTSLRLHLD